MKGVLLDVDGTLVLSNDAHAEAWVEAFDYFGIEVRFEDARRLIGMGGDKLIPKLVPGLDHSVGLGKEASDFRSALFLEKYASKLQPAPGSRPLVQRFLEDKVKIMIASSAKAKELEALLKAAGVDDLLKDATTSDDAEGSKPDPDIVHAALEKIGLPAEHVLMIGDTPYDLEAATRAKVGLVAVRCGGWEDDDLEGAVAMYNDPADLLAQYDSSPFKS